MSHSIRVLASKPGNLDAVSRTHMVGDSRLQRLFSDLCWLTVTYICSLHTPESYRKIASVDLCPNGACVGDYAFMYIHTKVLS